MLNLVKGGTEKKKMISKKAQQEIIVTVLLVLIALAAVAAVATFVINNVKKSTATADSSAQCGRVEFEITRAVKAEAKITIKRPSSSGEDVKLATAPFKVVRNGVAITALGAITVPTAGTTADITWTVGAAPNTNLAGSDKIELVPVLENGYVCPAEATETVAV